MNAFISNIPIKQEKKYPIKKRSKVLNMEMEIYPRCIKFADGLIYQKNEVDRITNLSNDQKRYVHEVKKIMEGTIL